MARIGPYAGNFGVPASSSPSFTASVDYFFNSASPISPEDAGGPGLSLVTIAPSSTGATFTWVTDVAASSRVDHGATTSYGSNVADPTLVTNHSIAVSGLTCGSTYHAQITSAVAAGSTVSPNRTFTTSACASAPDLTITKTHSGNFTQGSNGSYAVIVSNSGAAATSGTVTVTDTLPAGLTATAISGNGWTCSTPTLTCSRTDALNALASYPAITVAVSVAANAPASVTNTATVSGGGETNTGNDTASDPTTVNPSGGVGPLSDDYHSTTLNTGLWTFVNPVGDGSYGITGSNLLLVAPGAANHDPSYGGVNSAVRMLQAVANTDFQLEVKFDSKPTQKYQMQGLLVEQDATNYLRFEVSSNGASTSLGALKIVSSAESTLFATPINIPGSSIWLRVQRAGSTWTLAWSSDGTAFNTGGTFTQALTAARVGPYAGNFGSPASSSPALTVSVDYFSNSASPINPEDGGGPGLNLVTITPSGNAATFAWSTDVAASSRVDYGATTSYGSNVSDPALVTSHSMVVTGLTCATTYNARITSAVAGGSTVSPNRTFTTGPCGVPPDLTITKTHSGNFPLGGNGSYSIVVSNSGGAATSGTVTVADTLPSGLTATSISGSGWTCSTPPTLNCTRTDVLNASSAYPAITVSVSVATNAPSSVTNTATVSGGGETNTSNNTASDPTLVGAPSTNPTSDDFSSLTLNSGLWTYTKPMGGNYSLNGTNLLIYVQGGVAHDPIQNGVNYSSRMMQAMSNVDFGVEVKFDSIPTLTNTLQGIQVRQDDSNFLRFEFQGNGGGTTLFAGRFIGGSALGIYNSAISITGGSVWMRLTRSGNNWALSWSPNGTSFTTATTFSQALNMTAIGPMAGNSGFEGPKTPDFTASIDYFFNVSGPIAPEDGGSPQISDVRATVGARSAAITWNTDVSSTSRVDYGLTPSWGSNATSPGSSAGHTVLLTGLACGTPYSYAVTSVDGGGKTRQSPALTFTTPSCANPSTPVSDNFDVTSINTSRWTFLDPAGESYLAANGTTAQITVSAETIHDVGSATGNSAARIMQPILDTDFDVAAKFVSDVMWGSTGQGIVVEQDALNYLRFEFRHNGTGTRIWAVSRSGATQNTLVDVPFHGYAPLWLRVTRTGSTWTVKWSTDGSSYTQAGTFQQTSTAAAIGLYATNYASTRIGTPAFTASVDSFVNLSSPVSNTNAPTPYSRVVVDPNPGTVLVQETAGDLDGDGRPDLVIGFTLPKQGIYWYRAPHSGVLTDPWDKFTIVASGICYEDVTVFDVNGDGAKDIIASIDTSIKWFENPAGHGGNPTTDTWVAHVIDSNATGENNFIMKDMDGDGVPDMVTPHSIYFRTGANSWQELFYDNNFRGVTLLDIGSGKGDINIIATAPTAPFGYLWFENPRETGGNARTGTWTAHYIGPSYQCNDPVSCYGDGSVANLASGDFNGDGRMDFVTVQSEGYPLYPVGGIIWWEAPADRRNGQWIKHTIDPDFIHPHNVWVADMDKNGTLDIIAAEQEQSPERRISVFLNDGHANFTQQILSNSASHNPFLTDMNGDGWLDLFSANHGRFGAQNPMELYINPGGGFRLP